MYSLFAAGAECTFSFCFGLVDVCLARSLSAEQAGNPKFYTWFLLCYVGLLRHTRAPPFPYSSQ